MPIINGRGRVGIRKPSSQIVTSGLVFNLDAGNAASYPGTGTTWTDLSGNGYNGTLTNGPVYSSANGGSIVFDGSNDFVNLGTSAALKFANNFTINIWFKFNTKTGTQTIISNNQSGGYGIISNNTLSGFVGTATDRIVTFFYINGTYYLVGDNLSNYSTNIWYNVSVTYDGNVIKYYRNGSLIESYGIVGSVTATGEPLTIGANPAAGGTAFDELFNGSIAQVSMYNKALSAAEVLQNYNALKSRYVVALVNSGLMLHLDAGNAASYPGTGTTWTDLSGNGYNGTLTNGPTYNSANGGSIVFDGTNDYADFGDVLDIGLNSLSVNLWLKINSNWGVAFVNGPITSTAKYFIGKGVIAAQDLRWFLGFTQAKNLRAVFVGNNSESLVLNTNSSLNLNQWYMCTMVANRASSVKLYINGSLQGVDANASMSNFAALNFQNNTPLRVGSATLYDNSSSVTEFPGNISEVQMYFRALSDSEVMQNFNAQKSRYGL